MDEQTQKQTQEPTNKEVLLKKAFTSLKEEQVNLSLMEQHFTPKIWEHVSMLGSDIAYMKDSASVEEMMALLSGRPYKQERYYMSGETQIAVTYSIDKVRLVFYIPATQENLTAISGGRCVLASYTSPATSAQASLTINCNLA